MEINTKALGRTLLKYLESEDLRIKVELSEGEEIRRIIISKKENDVKEIEDIKIEVTKMIKTLGMSTNIKGYNYLRYAIIIAYEDNKIMEKLTKKLYPKVADKYNTTAPRVARAMRHAIETTWEKGNTKKINEIFEWTVNPKSGRPTNGEFISLMVDNLKLKNNV